ncbi:Z1 domain-containing protein [Spiroplasma culicicola]|uniref:Endonuclease Z1 domain-containing protein n=1 Tax=Spiroplasma culicicola AES-1 TaxID=1276246 RepID=W6A701_9MOLU|nr:Z1 domain-containing protein [Spiroplasma culicicola]AHI52762.1 hypothetical protein SCULI_v1c04210 [Spiroplasma culicicola AES-1]
MFKFIKDLTIEYRNNFVENDHYKKLKNNFLESNPHYMKDAYRDVYEVNVKNTLSVFNDELKRSSILLAGEVQSGKTNNMLFITAALIGLGFNKIIYFTGTKNNLNKQNIKRFKDFFKDAEFKDFSNAKSLFNNSNKVEIFYGIKQNLGNINSLLNDMDISQYENWNVLIIDDECDEASSEKTKENRTVNANILKLYETNFKKVVYLPVTATPYANLTSFTDGLAPNYVIPLVSSTSYCGLKVFSDNDLYKIIDKSIVDKIYARNFDVQTEEIFMKYIIDFLIECYRDEKNYQFLINITVNTTPIKDYDKYIRKIISKLKVKNKAFYNNFIGNDEYISFKQWLDKLEVKMIIEGFEYIRTTNPEIIIGGNLLSRGITFDDLIYEIMLNHSESGIFSSDTLLQRARWFGYRLRYIYKMRIYTSNIGYNFYNNIYEIDTRIRSLYENDYSNSKDKIMRIKDIFKEYSYKWTN